MRGPASHPKKDEILARVDRGEKIVDVAKAYGITRKTIHNWRRKGQPSTTVPTDTPSESEKPEYSAALKAAELGGESDGGGNLSDQEAKDAVLDIMTGVNATAVGLGAMCFKIPADHPKVAEMAQLSAGERVIYGEMAPSVAKHLGLKSQSLGEKATWLFVGLAIANEAKRFFELWRLAKSLSKEEPVSPRTTQSFNMPPTDNPGFNGTG